MLMTNAGQCRQDDPVIQAEGMWKYDTCSHALPYALGATQAYFVMLVLRSATDWRGRHDNTNHRIQRRVGDIQEP